MFGDILSDVAAGVMGGLGSGPKKVLCHYIVVQPVTLLLLSVYIRDYEDAKECADNLGGIVTSIPEYVRRMGKDSINALVIEKRE